MYIKSKLIEVFPTTKRQVTNKVFSEYTTTRLVYELLDMNNNNDGFIVDYDNSNANDIKLSFNIMGYYFNTNHFETIMSELTSGNYIYANIKIDSVTSETYPELSGTDSDRDFDTGEPSDSSVYGGVEFSNSQVRNTAQGQYSILLFNKINNQWILNEDARIKFNTSSIRNIDGGII